ncbi:DUF1178 family protein [Hydrogenophaga sp. PAMC20947]|nr:DUF1178 family protein [Hydrogenophaga sp. PAMC20947]QCB46192.1 DUF1178 family protein [Hydrogenophaga sp. PAMC20947]
MKVLDLQCSQHHSFEGWFGSEADYIDQQDRGLLTCPLCGDSSIQKMLSAPRLNLKAGRERPESGGEDATNAAAPESTAASDEPVERSVEPVLQARLMQVMREVLTKSEDVGDRFADQARGMHHGDIPPRSIRGQATPDVAQELIEEGIDVMALPALPGLKGTLQ